MSEIPWTPVAAADSVEQGHIEAVVIGEQDLVVWRSSNGSPCVMDARCPHQHSHLAAEGSIDGDEIICCTHWWRFDCSGNGSYLGAGGQREERANIAVFASREANGQIQAQLPDLTVSDTP